MHWGAIMRFHSINIPSEWGFFATKSGDLVKCSVSIQLISPASGDPLKLPTLPISCLWFPFN